MDPNANVAEQLAIAARILASSDHWTDSNGEWQVDSDDAYQLAELVQSMDEWMSRGCFPPARWDAS